MRVCYQKKNCIRANVAKWANVADSHLWIWL